MNVLLCQVHTYESNSTDSSPTVTDVTQKLQRGPYYFARDHQGGVVRMWFSDTDTAKLVMMKHAIATSMHLHLPVEQQEVLLQEPMHFTVPETDGHSTSVMHYKAQRNVKSGGLTVTGHSAHSVSTLYDTDQSVHIVIKPRFFHSSTVMMQISVQVCVAFVFC